MFPVVQVPSDGAGIFESLGTKAKFWYDREQRLFKEGRAGTGENWAEVVCAEIAEKLGLPHAEYSLAEFNGVKGISSPNFVPAGARLVLGNELINPVADSATAFRQTRRQAHTVRRIATLMRQPAIRSPLDWQVPPNVNGAPGTMTGYLLLDALVANQDRHEENWGLIVVGGDIYLAPTFDHASSLGRNEPDSSRLAKLAATRSEHAVEGYARRAKSQIFSANGDRLSTRDAFAEFGSAFPKSSRHWVERLQLMNEDYFREVMAQVPADWITEPGREFAIKLLEVNRKSLLELHP